MDQKKDYLSIGESIVSNEERIYSPNKCWRCHLWGSGELVISTVGFAKNKDYVFSNWSNGVPYKDKLIALLQEDGNFVCYKDKAERMWRNAVWDSKTVNKAKPPFFIMLEDNGQLVLYKGNSPSNKGERVWSVGTDNKVEAFNANSVEYDVDKVVIDKPQPLSLYSELVRNETDVEQSSSISGTVSVAEQKNWSNSVSTSTSIKVGAKFTVPFVKMEVSSEVSVGLSDTMSEGGSHSVTNSYGFNATLKVPPHTTYKVDVVTTKYKFTMPYKINGYYSIPSLKDKEWAGAIPGVFSGENAVDFHVVYTKAPVKGAAADFHMMYAKAPIEGADIACSVDKIQRLESANVSFLKI
jgi:hypothetical protein